MNRNDCQYKLVLFFLEDHIAFYTNKIDTDFHQHHYIQLTLAFEHAFTVKIEKQEFQTMGVIINSNQSHKIKGNDGWQLYLLVNPESLFGEVLRQKLDDDGIYRFEYINKEIIKTITSIQNLQQYELFIHNIKKTLHLNLTSSHSLLDLRIQQVVNYIENAQLDIVTIKQLSEHIYLSESRLSHLFKEEMGISLTSFLVHEKLKRAFQLILSGMKMTDAAFEAGFHSSSHFARSAKERLGMTPSAIKKDSIYMKV